ncbi:MAG TPA: hypothetical protein VJL57_01075 [Candidatus Paceibacterota bacterium]
MAKKSKIDSIEKLGALVEKLAALVVDGFHDMKTEVSEQFGHVGQRFDRMGERFERVEKRLEHLEIDNRDIKESLRHVQHDTGEMKDELRAISRAVDKDATTIIRQGSRLKRLEKRRTFAK